MAKNLILTKDLIETLKKLKDMKDELEFVTLVLTRKYGQK